MRLLAWTLALLLMGSRVAEAAPVGAIFTAISSWTIGSFAVGSFLLRFAGGMVLSALARALQRKPQAQKPPGMVNESTTAGETTPASFILGRTATAGNWVAPPMTQYVDNGDPEVVVQVIDLGDIPVCGIDAVWLEDARFPLPASYDTGGLGGMYIVPSIEKRRIPEGAFRIKWYLGDQTAADPYLLSTFGSHADRPWSADMIGRGTPYIVARFRFHREEMTSMPQNLLFEVRGIGLYDPRKDSSVGGSGPHRWSNPATFRWDWSDNPAVQVYNILRGIRFSDGSVWGGEAAAEDLPLSNWFAAMNVCDELVEGQPRYRTSMEVLAGPEEVGGMEPAAVIEAILTGAAGEIVESGGVYKVRFGGPGLPVKTITDDDIIITQGQTFDPFKPLTETYNGVQAHYPEPEERWASKEAPPRYSPEFEAVDGRRLMASLDLAAVPYADQVQRIQTAYLTAARRFRDHGFTLPPDAAELEPLDVLAYSSQRNGYVTKSFDLQSTSENLRTLDTAVGIGEVDPDDYDWSPDFKLPTVVNPPGTTQPVLTLKGFGAEGRIIADDTGAARKPAIRLYWWPEIYAATALEYEVRPVGQTALVEAGSTEHLSAGEHIVSGPIAAGGQYQTRARLVARRTTQWTAWVTVQAPVVKLGVDDVDVPAIVADVQQAVDDLEGWATGTSQALLDLEQGIADAEQLAADNLNLARDYTDTSITTERALWQGADQALSAQVQTLTAVLNSENLIENPRFSDGLTGWSGSTGNTTVVAQDTGSSDPIVAGVPTGHFALMQSDSVAARQLRQFFSVEWVEGEEFQWRLQLASAVARTDVEITWRWRNASGGQIGSTVTTNVSLAANSWKIFTGRHQPPAGAVQVRFDVRIPPTTVTAPLAIADTSATKVDVSVIARVTSLEVAFASSEDALALFKQSAEARLDGNEAAVTAEALARATEDMALAGRVDTVEAKADAARTYRQATAPSNPKNGDLWIDTGNDSKLKRWNGSAWVDADDARIAQNTAAITTEQAARADADGALADSLTTVSARTDRASASGLLRITSTAAPTGAQSRIALRAEASSTDTSHSAAMYLDARSDGTSQAGFVADRFFIASDTGAGASRAVPFIVENGVVYIDVARIREATIDTLHMASGSMVSGYTTTFSFSGGLDTAIINVPAYSSQSALMVMAQGTLISPNDDNTLCYMFVELNGTSRKPIWSTLSVSGPLGIRTHYFSAFCVYGANTGVNQINLSHQSASSVTGTLTVLELKRTA